MPRVSPVVLGPLLLPRNALVCAGSARCTPAPTRRSFLNDEAPTRRRLQRDLEILAGEPAKEAAHPLAVSRSDTRSTDLSGHAVKPLRRDLCSVLVESHYDRHRGLLKLHGLNTYADYPRLS